MAIFHLTQSHISRSTGRTAVGAWAYVTAGETVCERTGVVFDYGCKNGVVASGMVLTSNAPEWAQDGERFWNELALFEDRLGAQRYKNPERRGKILGQVREALTQELSLPRDLTFEQNQALVLDYIAQNITARDLECGYGMHWDQGNPHVHILVSERRFTPDGTFSSLKEREVHGLPFLNASRECWAKIQNEHLMRHGFDVRVDHRSHKDRGLSILPTIHEGWYAQSKARQDERMDRMEINGSIKVQNAALVTEAPLEILKEISSLKATFTEQDLTRLIFSRVQGDDALFHAVHDKVMNHADLIKIGENIAGREIFSTASYKISEEALAQTTQALVAKQNHKLNAVRMDKALKSPYAYFSAAQKAAVRRVCDGEALSVVIGRAGTGKTSTVLMASSSLYQKAGYRVRGMALAGAAVDNLVQDLNIEGRTIAAWEWAWNQHDTLKAQLPNLKEGTKAHTQVCNALEGLKDRQLTKRDVIILDEIGMVGVPTLQRVLAKAYAAGAKVIAAGDNHQFAAIESGDALRALLKHVRAAEIKEVKRQHEPWMQGASQLFAELKTAEGLEKYYEQGCIHWQRTEREAVARLAGDYIQDRLLSPQKSQLAMAYTHAQIEDLNGLIRERLKEEGLLKEFTRIGCKDYGIGERIVFLKNESRQKVIRTLSPQNPSVRQKQGVKNGSFGTIYAFNKGELYVKLDDGRSIRFNALEYKSFQYGYAVTAHKSQGATVDNVYAMASSFICAQAIYVMMTRHRNKVGLYTSREAFEDFNALSRQLSRVQNKDLILDYTITEEHRPFWRRVQDYQEMTRALAEMRSRFEGQSEVAPKKILFDRDPKKASAQHWENYQALKRERDGLAKTIARNWGPHGLYVQQCHIPRETLEVHAGMRPKRLSEVEKKARDRVELYAESTTKARDLWNVIKLSHPGAMSRQHDQYSAFDALRIERDSLAATLADNARLHRPFTKDAGVNWHAINAQSLAHQKRALEGGFHKGLSHEDKALYDQVAAYRQARNQCTRAWHELKGAEKALAPWENEGFDAWKVLRDERDGQAALIIANLKAYSPFFERLKINEESLYQEGHSHKMRDLVKSFKTTQDQAQKSLIAVEIQRWNDLERGEGKKYLYSCLMEAGIKPLDIRETVERQRRSDSMGDPEQNLKTKLGLQGLTQSPYQERRSKEYSEAWHDADKMTEDLKSHTRELATALLGTPNQHMSNTQQLRFGKSGKIVVNFSGSKAGTWHDFSTGESGNLLKLIQREQQIGFKDALHYAADFAGLSPGQGHEGLKAVEASQAEKNETPSIAEQEEHARKLARVQKLYEESKPVQGTLAERYLKEHRHILAELPESLRFHPEAYESQTKKKMPALIAFASNSNGELKAAQVTYLDAITANKVNKHEIAVNKRSQGIVKGSFIELQKGEGLVYIAEGIETALSIKEAGVKGTVVASLGVFNVVNIEVRSKETPIIICADNDGVASNTHKLVNKAVKDLEARGHSVQVIRPLQEGYDFNDVLRHEGVLKIKDYVQATIQSSQITPPVDAVNATSQQPSPSEEPLLAKIMAEPRRSAEKAQMQEVLLPTPGVRETNPSSKIIEKGEIAFALKAGPVHEQRAEDTKAGIEAPPSVEAYQDLLKQRRSLSQRGQKDPEIIKGRGVIQDKINAMAYELMKDPQMMVKAKEVDLHMSIERMAAYHTYPRQMREQKPIGAKRDGPITPSKEKEHPPLIQDYIELQGTRRKIGFASLAKTPEQAAECRAVADAIEQTAYKISQDTELNAYVQSHLPKLYKGVQLQAEFHEAGLKPHLTRNIDYEI